MTLSELRNLVRVRIRDKERPYLCSDEEIDININEAQREACARALLIEEDSIQIDLNTSDLKYDLDPRIIDVLAIKIGTDTLRDFTDDWTLTETKLVLSKAPTSADVLTLTCQLLPATELADDSDEPEIRRVYQTQMLDWAISLCFQSEDSELFDQQASDRYAARFTQAFGERPSALTRRNHRSKPPKAVAYNGCM